MGRPPLDPLLIAGDAIGLGNGDVAPLPITTEDINVTLGPRVERQHPFFLPPLPVTVGALIDVGPPWAATGDRGLRPMEPGDVRHLDLKQAPLPSFDGQGAGPLHDLAPKP